MILKFIRFDVTWKKVTPVVWFCPERGMMDLIAVMDFMKAKVKAPPYDRK